MPPSTTGYRSSLEDGVAGLRVVFSPNLGYANVDPEVAAAARAAAHTFAALGAHVEEVDPGFDDPLEAFTVLWYAGAAQALVPFDEASRAGMDRGLLEIAAEGAGYSALRYLDAVMQRGNLGVGSTTGSICCSRRRSRSPRSRRDEKCRPTGRIVDGQPGRRLAIPLT